MHMESPPATPTDYFATYTTGLWDLGAVLKPVRRIVLAVMDREAIDYEQAIHYLVGEYFVSPYSLYREKYLRQGKAVPFDAWSRIEFVYRVRRGYAYGAKRHRIALERGILGDGRSLDDIAVLESHANLETPGDQVARAIDSEETAERLALQAALLERLTGLEPIESFVVWNHAGLGRTYDDIANSLGISPTTAKKIFVGVTATLRRELASSQALG